MRAGRTSGILPLRSFAYLVDLCIVGLLGIALWLLIAFLSVVSFGLLGFFAGALPFTAILYHALLVGGPASASWGMRLAGIRMVRQNGSRPSHAEAAVQAILFYVSMAMSHLLVLAVPLLHRRRRMLHPANGWSEAWR